MGIMAQSSDYTAVLEESGEIYFCTRLDDPDWIQKLSRLVSIDKVEGETAFAYANKAEFDRFLKLGFSWEMLPRPGLTGERPVMMDHVNLREVDEWDFYPTYEAYLDIMNQFAADYPEICETFSIGQSVEGRELMMVKISDHIGNREAEPQFLYTGTMHGDELAGYILLLRLADHLLSNYGTDPEITNLVNNTEIWINPLANPDGTYNGGNHTVWNSTRYNANYVDINRNFPDPEDGPHPDGNAWQPETLAFMQLAEDNNFVMSANTHGGAEVINYPWDTWQHLTADDDWWVFVCREYADTVHAHAPSTYLDGFNNGITNGYAWYTISGGRQDYMNYFHHCREVTMELSNVKKLQTSLLDAHWEWNRRSLINYIRQCNYGLSGVVTDVHTGEPVGANVVIEGHDMDNSFVVADQSNGFYQRLLEAGVYNLTYVADGYDPVTIPDVVVSRYSLTNLDVQLDAGELIADFYAASTVHGVGGTTGFTDQSTGAPVQWAWQFEGATPAASEEKNPTGILYEDAGIFDVTLTVKDSDGDVSVLTKKNYIQVYPEYLISNDVLTLADGILYDSGGENGNYQNNEDFTLTIYPAYNQSKIHIEFLVFNLESHSSCNYDWMKIYDGTSAESPLLGTWCGSNSPGFITASNSPGALTIQFHSDNSVNLAGWEAAITCKGLQTVELVEGWKGVSFFVEPDDQDIGTLWSDVHDDLVILVGDGGVYRPAQNLNTLGLWDYEKGYVVKMNAAGSLPVSGTLRSDKVLDLSAGWNYFPVLSNNPVQTEYLQNHFGESMILIKEIAGLNSFWPEMGISTLTWLQPGNAYYIFLSDAATFTFPEFDRME